MTMQAIINKIVTATTLSTQQAWWLLEFITNKSRAQLQYSSDLLTESQEHLLADCIDQIAVHHKPLAYILGFVPFLELELLIAPPTLIPRPETEYWVDQLIAMIKDSGATNLTILDIGTGSGCIGLSLAHALPTAQVYAVDIAQSAVTLSQKNAQKNNVANIRFLQSDLFNTVPADLQFDIIVSNPPYIDPAAQLQSSVLDWEDHGALFAQHQGMQIIEKIAGQAHCRLKKNDKLAYQLIMEIDASQGSVLQKLLLENNFADVVVQKDQFDRDRTVWAK